MSVDIVDAIQATEYVLERVYLLPVSKALDPLNPVDYAVIEARFSRALRNAVKGSEGSALRGAIDALDIDWRKASASQKDAAFLAADSAIKKHTAKAAKAAVRVIKTRSESIVLASRKSVKRKFSLDSGEKLTPVDKRIISHSAKSQAGFIRDEYGRQRAGLSKTARGIVSDGLKKGESRKQIVDRLDATLTAKGVKRSRWYWDTVANNISNRSRSYASLVSYKEHGIQRYIFDAVLDEVTTPQCRFLHGRSFEVELAVTKYKEVEDSSKFDAVVDIQPWIRSGKNAEGQEQIYIPHRDGSREVIADIKRSGVGNVDDTGEFRRRLSDAQLHSRGVTVPPLHGGCRSRIIPDFA
jgi:SPP1 gp7 family putative phage head morphogenesis protein